MAVVKRFLIYIIAGLLVLAAVGFHFAVTRKLSAQFETKLKGLQTLRDKLKGYAQRPKDIHNDASIAAVQKRAEKMTEQINQSERFLALQPRHAHTRRFLENEKMGAGKEIKENVTWLGVYERMNEQLRIQLAEAGFSAFNVKVSNAWGMGVPTDPQITAAMEMYWRQKDLADFFTGQVEKDLAEYMAATSPDGSFPAKPSDLVISRNYSRLDDLLRGESLPALVQTFQAIIFNPKEQDLAVIFDQNLPTFPWSQVLAITLDDTQRRYLDDLLPAGNEDIANRQRFKDFIMELRQVRYRTDVTALLDRDPLFTEVASKLRKGTTEERDRLVAEMPEWGSTKLAQAIAAIVCIRTEKDYAIVRKNHSPQVVELASLTLSAGPSSGEFGSGGPMGGPRAAAMAGAPGGIGASESTAVAGDLYNTLPFSMRVKIEYDRIPVFLRRFLDSSWRYNIKVMKIVPTSAGTQMSEGISGRSLPLTGGMPGGMPGGAFGSGFGTAYGSRMPTTMAPPRSTAASGTPTEGAVESVAIKNYVWLDIRGDAYQFSPVRQKLEKAAKSAAAASAGGDAP